MKKQIKKIVLSKETLRNLSTPLEGVLQKAAGGAFPLTLAPAAATSFTDWTTEFQNSIRALGTDVTVPTDLQPYFATASVVLLGDGSPTNPRRFLITPGTAVGARQACRCGTPVNTRRDTE